MITPTGGADKALGIHLVKTYKTIENAAVQKSRSNDSITISAFSKLVEKARSEAMAIPDVREDKIADSRKKIGSGIKADSSNIASAMISQVLEGNR